MKIAPIYRQPNVLTCVPLKTAFNVIRLRRGILINQVKYYKSNICFILQESTTLLL